MKSKLKGAQTGHDLLKRKSEALTKCAMPDPSPYKIPTLFADILTSLLAHRRFRGTVSYPESAPSELRPAE